MVSGAAMGSSLYSGAAVGFRRLCGFFCGTGKHSFTVNVIGTAVPPVALVGAAVLTVALADSMALFVALAGSAVLSVVLQYHPPHTMTHTGSRLCIEVG